MEFQERHIIAIDNTIAALNKATFKELELDECQAMVQSISRLLEIKQFIRGEIDKPKEAPKKKRSRQNKVESVKK